MRGSKKSKSLEVLEFFAEMDIGAFECIKMMEDTADYIKARAAFERIDVQLLSMRDVLANPDPESAWFQEEMEDAFRAYREAEKQYRFAAKRISKYRKYAET